MFIEFFDWFCNSLKDVFSIMDKFILFDNFSYFDFACSLLATGIIIKLVKFIMGIEDEEPFFGQDQPESNGNYMPQYDGYTPRHFKTYKPMHGPYEPKHERKKRGWF